MEDNNISISLQFLSNRFGENFMFGISEHDIIGYNRDSTYIIIEDGALPKSLTDEDGWLLQMWDFSKSTYPGRNKAQSWIESGHKWGCITANAKLILMDKIKIDEI